jgi:alkylation response protein AidB-like acyl-CoA dehydrogenase
VDLEYTEDQEELRQSVRAFLAAECPPSVVRRVVETGEPARDLWAAMVGLDWPALNVPEDCGGMGLGTAEVSVVVEELGAVAAPGPYLATASQFVPAVSLAGTAEQRARYLEPVSAGERVGALALADHPRCWSVDDVTATAERAAGGWTLRGEKHGVLIGPGDDADVVVAARVDGGGLGLFVVPASALDIRAVRSLDGSRPLSRIVLDGTAVPAEAALGEAGSPAVAAALTRTVEEAALALSLEAVGACRTLFAMTLQHAKDRHQFGVPIGSFQAVKHKLADVHLALERARALALFAVAAAGEDDPRLALAIAMAKAAADDCQRLVCQEAIQTFGGIGFTWESDVHLYVKRAQAAGALFGSAADHRMAVARHLGVAS